jgi:hypothetical protein
MRETEASRRRALIEMHDTLGEARHLQGVLTSRVDSTFGVGSETSLAALTGIRRCVLMPNTRERQYSSFYMGVVSHAVGELANGVSRVVRGTKFEIPNVQGPASLVRSVELALPDPHVVAPADEAMPLTSIRRQTGLLAAYEDGARALRGMFTEFPRVLWGDEVPVSHDLEEVARVARRNM